jgi:hypothetical protein
MAFDGRIADYTKVAPVFDKENPPTRMSDAIRMAVADMEVIEQTPGYQIAFPVVWHEPYGEYCRVCFAGCVMARTLGAKPNQSVWFDDREIGGPDRKWMGVFQALDAIRNGSVGVARSWWPEGFNGVLPVQNWPVADYTADPIGFKRDMLALADRLQAEGS